MKGRRGVARIPLVSRSDGLTVCTKVETHNLAPFKRSFISQSRPIVNFTFRLDALIDTEDQSVYERLSEPNI